MKWSLTAVAVALFVLGLFTGCNNTNNSVQYATGATIINIAPSGVIKGGSGITLTVSASPLNGFKTNTVVQWGGQNLATTYLDATTVTAVVPADLISKAGTVFVNTFYPQSGTGMNGLSNSLAFLIYGEPNPKPTLTSISPTTTVACGANCSKTSVTITLTGSDFLPSSTNGGTVVTIADKLTPNGQATAINISSFSATVLKAVIPGTFLANPDTAVINVINPPSGVCLVNCPDLGGGIGQPQLFSITGGAASTAAAGAVAEETPAVSADGRYVAFSSLQNEVIQILLRDTCIGAPSGCAPVTQTVSVANDGTAGNDASHSPVISADGRYVAFSSAATNLLSGTPAGRQIYLRDTCVGAPATCKAATSLISTDPEGKLNGAEGILPSISSSGRYVAFVAVTPSHDAPAPKAQTAAPSTAAPNSGLRQVFLRDTCLNTANCTPKTTRISLQPGDAPADSSKTAGPALSGLAKQIALADEKNSTVMTHTVPVDDRVFLAITDEQK
jgi:hypothetical protein